MGLKLGIHLMRGIPRQAVDRQNVPILGTDGVQAADIANMNPATHCPWNTDMHGVDMTEAGGTSILRFGVCADCVVGRGFCQGG